MTAEETLEERSPVEESPAEESSDGEVERERVHLTDVEDGAGCTEIWEHLSERRDEADEE